MGFGLLKENQHNLGIELGIWGLVLKYLCNQGDRISWP